MTENPVPESHTLFEWVAKAGPVAISAATALGALLAFVIARYDKAKQAQRFKVESDRMERNIGDYKSLLQNVRDELESVRNDPARIVVPHLESQIEILESQKSKLERELKEVKTSLRRLQSGLEKIYQESKRSIIDIPGAKVEEDTYKAQIKILSNYLDDIRSSIVDFKSVSVKFSRGGYSVDSKEREIEEKIARLQMERQLASASVARFKAVGYMQERSAQKASSRREAEARADARAKAEAKAEHAHLRKRSRPLDD